MVTVTKLPTPPQDQALKFCSVYDVHRITTLPIDKLTSMNVNSFVETASAIISKRISGKVGLYSVANELYNGSYNIDYMGFLAPVNFLKLNNAVINSITSLTVKGTTITPSSLQIDGNIVYLSKTSELQYFPTFDVGSIDISYECGNLDINVENVMKLLTQNLTSLLLLRTLEGRNLFLASSFNTEFGEGKFTASDYDDIKNSIGEQVKFLFQEVGVENIDF